MVRHSFIGAVLNGPRPRRARRLQTQSPSSTPVASISESS